MAYAATLRGPRAVYTVPASLVGRSLGWSVLRSVAGAVVDSRRRSALREIKRHQPFGPLASIRHIGLTRDELMTF